ncbi:MAG: flagellar brake protein [Rhodocyclaceae bacterium]
MPHLIAPPDADAAPDTPGPALPEAGSGHSGDKNAVVRRNFPFKDMRLTVGDRLQVQCPSHLGATRVFVRVVGYLEDVSLIVTAPFRNGSRVKLIENEILVVRAFSRQSAFAFRCSVLRVCKLPFDYLHLSFPDTVQGSVIRKSTRVRASVPVEIGNGTDAPATGVIENISFTGALIIAQAALGTPGDVLRLRFGVALHEVETRLELEARLLNVMQDEDGADGAQRHGVEFIHTQPNDRMILKSLVYQQLIENPDSVV